MPTAIAVFSPPSVPTVLPADPKASRYTFWSRKLIAKLVTRSVAGEAPAQRPERDPLHHERAGDDYCEAREDRDDPGLPAQVRERVRAGGDQLTVGEVDEPENAEDEADPHRDDRVDGTEPDPVDQGLQKAHDGTHGAHER